MCDYEYDLPLYPGDNCTSVDYAGSNETEASAYATPGGIVNVRSIMIIFLVSVAWVLSVIYACSAARHEREISANDPSRRSGIPVVANSAERAEKVKNALTIMAYAEHRKEDERLGGRKGTCSIDMDSDVESQIEVDTTDDDPSSGGDSFDAIICSICLCPYKAHDDIASPKSNCCKHIYHSDCLMLWLSKNDGCPICRENIMIMK